MINANELRLGNTIEYHIADTVDGTDQWIDNAVDIGDLECLLEDPEDPFYRPKVLTEECLVDLGFVSNAYQDRYENKAIHVECNKTKGYVELWIERMPHVKYVHQLQNLYFALTGEELKEKEVES